MGSLDMKNKIYEGEELKDFRALVSLYKNRYRNLIAFEFFAKDIENLGANLMRMHLKRVCLVSDNRYEWFVSYLAITTAGLEVVPLDKALPDNELEDSIIRSQADAIICSRKYNKAVENVKKKTHLHSICMDSSFFRNMIRNTMHTSNKYYTIAPYIRKHYNIFIWHIMWSNCSNL